jgi:hypothetical protein
MFGISSYTSEITGSAENAVSPHVDIPHTGTRGYGLLLEAVLQKSSQFLYKQFLFVLLPFRGYPYKLCLLTTPEKKMINTGRMCWPNTTADNSVPEDIGQSLHTHTSICSVGSYQSC